MKSDPRSGLPDGADVADLHGRPLTGVSTPSAAVLARASARPATGSASGIGAWMVQAVLVVAIPLALLAVASVAALLVIRIGADLRLGLDPLMAEAARPRLPLYEVAGRAVASDVLRQLVIVALVLGLAYWLDGAAWRRRLALTRPAEPRTNLTRLWLLMAVWPVIHILWVTETAQVLNVAFGKSIRISPFLSPLAVAGWFLYVAVLAPIAEELLFRGEAFARASRFMRPAGAIVATALLFSLAHLSESGIARPISLLPLAITLSWLRWRTGRLWPCILLHGWSNLALVLYLLWPTLRW